MHKVTINSLTKSIDKFKTMDNLDPDYLVSGIISKTIENKTTIEIFNIDDAVKSALPVNYDIAGFINKSGQIITYCGFGNNNSMILFGDLEKNLVPISIKKVKGLLFY